MDLSQETSQWTYFRSTDKTAIQDTIIIDLNTVTQQVDSLIENITKQSDP